MQVEEILRHPPLRLTERQRRDYFETGFLAIERAVSEAWTARLREAMAACIARSAAWTQSDDVFALEDGHSAERPRLHRMYSPQDHHGAFWDFICAPETTALAADLVGPDVKFHHAKLNFKSSRGSRGFKWHQDIQAWPHTDYSPVTLGVYIDGCAPDQGPLSMIPGSHRGPLYSMYDENGYFAVRVPDADLAALGDFETVAPTGPPGTLVALHCRTVHGSLANASDAARPLLLVVYSSADSFSYTASPIESPRRGEIVRGQAARRASIDPEPCELPPDWGRIGYRGPWRLQQDEEERRVAAPR